MFVLKYFLVKSRPKSEISKLGWSKWFSYHLFGPKPDMDLFKVSGIAQGLYEEMYTKLASGEIESMQRKLCENINNSLSARIAGRPPNTRMQWTLHRYIAKPKLVSFRVTIMPLNEEVHERTFIAQAVVRIRSMQSLRKVRKVRGKNGKTEEILEEGSVGGGSGEGGKEVTEYFVVQKMQRRGKPGHWMVWGATNPTTLEKVLADEKRKKGLVQ